MDEFEAAWLAPIRKGVRLHFIGGSRDGHCAEIDRAGTYSFGRAEAAAFSFSCDDAVDAKVSREHAQIRVDAHGVVLERIKPTNGLGVFNVEVEEGRTVRLKDGDLIRLGRGGPRICVRIGELAGLADG